MTRALAIYSQDNRPYFWDARLGLRAGKPFSFAFMCQQFKKSWQSDQVISLSSRMILKIMTLRLLALIKPFFSFYTGWKCLENQAILVKGRLIICGLLKFIELLLVFGSFWNDSLKILARPFHFGLKRFIEIICKVIFIQNLRELSSANLSGFKWQKFLSFNSLMVTEISFEVSFLFIWVKTVLSHRNCFKM